jgi:hypothetical protein
VIIAKTRHYFGFKITAEIKNEKEEEKYKNQLIIHWVLSKKSLNSYEYLILTLEEECV